MRWRDIASGILLILSIIDFAPAAPVLRQEKRQAGVGDAVNIPKDVITVLGKRAGGEEFAKTVEDYLKTAGKSVDSSETPSLSGSTELIPPGFRPGLKNVVESPVKNPASLTANPSPISESSQPSSRPPMQGNDDPTEWPLDLPSLKEHGSDQESTEAPPPGPQPNSNKRPWTGPNPEHPHFDWEYWTKLLNGQPSKRPALAKESGLAHILEVHVDSGSKSESDSSGSWMSFEPSPSPERVPSPEQMSHMAGFSQPHAVFPLVDDDVLSLWAKPAPSADPNFDWEYWVNMEDPPQLKPVYPKPLSLRPSNPRPSNPESPNSGPPNPGFPGLSNTEPSNPDPSNPSLQTEPENPSDQQPLTEEEQRLADLYAAKGKAKVLRRYSGTARDVENVAHGEFQLAERSLDAGGVKLERVPTTISFNSSPSNFLF